MWLPHLDEPSGHAAPVLTRETRSRRRTLTEHPGFSGYRGSWEGPQRSKSADSYGTNGKFFGGEDSPALTTDDEGNVRFHLAEDRFIVGVWVNGSKMLGRGDFRHDGKMIKLTINK
jgi:hypothetical protein